MLLSMILVYKIINSQPILVKLHLIKKTKNSEESKACVLDSAILGALLPPGDSKPQGQAVGAQPNSFQISQLQSTSCVQGPVHLGNPTGVLVKVSNSLSYQLP